MKNSISLLVACSLFAAVAAVAMSANAAVRCGALCGERSATGPKVYSESTSPTISEKTYETELCVVGGGMAGVCTAVSAARNGAKVVLVQDRPMLGGNASSEIRVPVSGAYGDPLPGGKVLENREGGIIEEIMLENIARNPTCNWHVWDHVLWNFVAREKNVKVLLNTSVMECRTEGNRIVSVTGWDLISYTRVTVKAKLFADCTGDGILRLSGALYMKGREGKRDFGESYAPDEGNMTVMGSTLHVFAFPNGLGNPPRTLPETAKEYPAKLRYKEVSTENRATLWTCGALELGGMTNTIEAASHVRDELFRYSYGWWAAVLEGLGDDGRDGAGRRWERAFASTLPGKRESIRFVGDHVLTQNDLLAGGDFPDEIGHGGWPMDDHFSVGMFGPKQTIFNPCPHVYGIPFRSLYSRNVENLMFAGRDVSVTHMALSSTRVQKTCSVMGQAIGTAAAIAIRRGTTPRGVWREHLAELQDTLQWQDQFLPHHPRKITDLSRRGRISHEVLRDGMDRIRPDGPHGVWLALGSSTSYEFSSPETFAGVRLVVDTNLNDNRWQCWWIEERRVRRLPDTMPRDFDVQVRAEGEWKTVAQVRDNARRFLDIKFSAVAKGDACRVVWRRAWKDDSDCGMFSFEVY